MHEHTALARQQPMVVICFWMLMPKQSKTVPKWTSKQHSSCKHCLACFQYLQDPWSSAPASYSSVTAALCFADEGQCLIDPALHTVQCVIAVRL